MHCGVVEYPHVRRYLRQRFYKAKIMDKLLRLHLKDNVFVVRKPLMRGESLKLNGNPVVIDKDLGFGHKIAAQFIAKGADVIKFGVVIGSATQDIPVGEHVHTHNLKSGYLPTYTRADEYIDK